MRLLWEALACSEMEAIKPPEQE
jgi:hypothetical protein